MYEEYDYPESSEYYDSDMWDDEDFEDEVRYWANQPEPFTSMTYDAETDELHNPDSSLIPAEFVQDSDVTDIEHELDTWVNSGKEYRNAQILLMFM